MTPGRSEVELPAAGLDLHGPRTPALGEYVRAASLAGRLVVQPRMGFGDPRQMRRGLDAVRRAAATTVGTLTVDSYTRVGDIGSAGDAVREGRPLNGYPIATHGPDVTRTVVEGMHRDGVPVQVRHGSAAPQRIIAAMIRAGLSATEGGPVSYCLPYGRTPLRTSVQNWRHSARQLRDVGDLIGETHVETFGGCMLGQLCPPELLVALSVLEGVFFAQAGVRSVSLSYAQQTNAEQDAEAIHALRGLADELLGDVDRHVVLYSYMGLYPRTPDGARLLSDEAARLATRTGAERLIVKTVAEAHRIPTVAENVEALEAAAGHLPAGPTGPSADVGGPVANRARQLVHAVLDLDDDVGRALVGAFERGLLDIPFCLHPDNAGRARSYIDTDGRLTWSDTGRMPLGRVTLPARPARITAGTLVDALSYVQRAFDEPRSHPLAGTTPRGGIQAREARG